MLLVVSSPATSTGASSAAGARDRSAGRAGTAAPGSPTVGTASKTERAHATSPTTSRSPYVTLEPTGPHGTIPGPADDMIDLYGIVFAIVAIAVVLVVVRLMFRNRRGEETSSR